MSDYIERNQKDPDHDLDSWHPVEIKPNMSKNQLYLAWMRAKADEKAAANVRRLAENYLVEALGISESSEGSQSIDDGQVRVKVTSRMNRKIDADALQEIAAENDLMSHLADLFRWKPEINMAAWKAADASITKPLEAAVTTKPGRPSFSIEIIKEV